MAQSRDFNGSNHVFAAPAGMEEFVTPLRVFVGNGQFISCWTLSDEEKAEIAKTGIIWLSVLGAQHPPVAVSGTPLIGIKDPDGTLLPYDVDAPTEQPTT